MKRLEEKTVLALQGVMLDCEELNWLERFKFLNWLFLPLNKRYLITKIENVEVDELLIHCKDDVGRAYVVCDCSFEFLDHMRKIFIVNVDVSWHRIRFRKTGMLDFDFST